ncbi:hypothetical protein AMTRI_Chr06g197120 [Amborella trichopoda]|uniref:DRBM domain-containing protein n=1 Tax=Amborella trichopoda TaxID=13333 RepID=W1PGQ7_AMBTC|nr:uncharacterized protein LOC18435103 [Amborella trichopoda]ERN06894.1 hypothetical protein AMTR_s00005p00253820 [Amborella trichopoda]|eukprot:XP_006845219.1 uncharacterized protein LOC18435103 [Amborella trichopoda]
MDDSVDVPMEEAVEALIDTLVCPLLPSRASNSSALSPAQEQKVANQMHAAVLLYNYYHRCEFPQLEFLGFENFCKVAVNAKPNLLTYMKFMKEFSTKSTEKYQELSLTEKMVKEACDIAEGLNASKPVPNIQSWPVTKVAVFLIDSMRKNCLLMFGSITLGVWSLIEEKIESKDTKMKAPTRVVHMETSGMPIFNSTEGDLLKIAFTAVKKQTGIDQADLNVLERSFSYSLSKKREAVQLYVMQSVKRIDGEIRQVPIKDVVNSLDGPIFRKEFLNYETTSVVEYFHLLPYKAFISEWFSREALLGGSKLSAEASANSNGSTGSNVSNKTNLAVNNIHPAGKIDAGTDNEALHHDHREMKHHASPCCIAKPAEEAKISPTLDCSKLEVTNDGSQDGSLEKRKPLPLTPRVSIRLERSNNDSVKEMDTSSKPCDTNKTNPELKMVDSSCKPHDTKLMNSKLKRMDSSSQPCDTKITNSEIRMTASSNSLCNTTNTKVTDSALKRVDSSSKACDTKMMNSKLRTMDPSSKPCDTKFTNSTLGMVDSSSNQSDTKIATSKPTVMDSPSKPSATNISDSKLEISSKRGDTKITNSEVKVMDSSGKPCDTKITNSELGGSKFFCKEGSHNQDEMLEDALPSAAVKGHSDKSHEVLKMLHSRRDDLFQAALSALYRKRDELVHQKRLAEDEICRCEKSLLTIMNEEEDALELSIDLIMEACKKACCKGDTQISTVGHETSRGNCSFQNVKRKKLSEAVLYLKSSCQELDEICVKNQWLPPSYNTFPADAFGLICANVMIHGVDFEFCERGELKSTPQEARESAAATMLTKLRITVSETQ